MLPLSSAKTLPETNLHHVGLVVPDLDEASNFLTEYLGAVVEFSLGPISDAGATARTGGPQGSQFELRMLRIGAARIELLQWWPAAHPEWKANTVGAFHVGVRVDDIEAALDRLRGARGVRVVSEPLTFTDGPTPGLTNAFVATSWGLMIELVSGHT